jgi:hypothetical protein
VWGVSAIATVAICHAEWQTVMQWKSTDCKYDHLPMNHSGLHYPNPATILSKVTEKRISVKVIE